MNLKYYIILLLSLFQLVTYSQENLIDKVVARVGSENILLSDVEEEYAYTKTSKPQLDETAKCEILKNIIAQKIIVYQAKLDSVEVKDEEVETQLNYRFESILRQMNGDEAFFKEYYGATVDEMKDRFRDDQKQKILAERMQGKLIDKVSITPKEVTEFFNSIPQDSIPYLSSEVELGEIVLKPVVNAEEREKARIKANDIREKILKGEDFGELAKKYSVDVESAKRGGDLGFAKRGVYVPEFEAAAYTIDIGETSELVETEFGFHIIQVVERRGNNIKVKHILISPEITSADRLLAKNKLDSIRNLISLDSMSFEEAVKRHSLKAMPSYSNNGRIKNQSTGNNYFDTKDLDPDTYFAIDKLEINGLSKVLELKDLKGEKMYRLLKLYHKSKPHKANLKQDYDKITFFAKESKKNKYFSEWIDDKMKKSYIKIDPLFYDCGELHQWIKMEDR